MEVCSGQVECAVPAKLMWQAAFKDGHVCLPQALPHAISHVTYDGPTDVPAPGLSCRTIHLHRSYAEAVAKERKSEKVVVLVKEKLEEIDRESMKVKVEMVEGGIVGASGKSAKQTVHIKEGSVPGASCVVEWAFEYEPLSEHHRAKVPLVLNEFVPRGYKKLEQYLLAHPEYKLVADA